MAEAAILQAIENLENNLNQRLDSIDSRLTKLEEKLDKVLAFIPIGNEDLVPPKTKMRKAH